MSSKKTHMTKWKPVKSTAMQAVPKKPCVYEFKHCLANDTQYIGSSNDGNRRIKEHLYKNQDVDKFIGNSTCVEFRHKTKASKEAAHQEEKKRGEEFVKKHGHKPDYNHRF